MKKDGSVVAWGDSYYGGTTGDKQAGLQSGVVRLVSTLQAFAAIKADGSVTVWGTPEWSDQKTRQLRAALPPWDNRRYARAVYERARESGEEQSFSHNIDLVIGDEFAERLFAGRYLFSCDPRLYAQPMGNDTGDLARIGKHPLEATEIVATERAVAVLSPQGSVEMWGDPKFGADSSKCAGLLAADVVHVSATRSAFAVLRADGSVLAFGNPNEGGTSESVASRIRSDVTQVGSTLTAFAALKSDGSVLTWGDPLCGGDSSNLPSMLTVDGHLTQDIVTLYTNSKAFAAITKGGAGVAWGASHSGGDVAPVSAQLTSGVVFMAATATAFAALKEDGSVVSWGNAAAGGDQSVVAKQLQSGVVFIGSTVAAFAALKSDGSVVAWGSPQEGGDTTAVADGLRGNVVSLATPFVDEISAVIPNCGLLITGNHAAPAGGSWQYSLDGRNWIAVPLELRPTEALVVRADARLRYHPKTMETSCSRYLSAIILSPDQGSFSTGDTFDSLLCRKIRSGVEGSLTLTPCPQSKTKRRSSIESTRGQ